MSSRFKFTTGTSSIVGSDPKTLGKILLRRSKFENQTVFNEIDHLRTYIYTHWFNQTISIIIAFKNNNNNNNNSNESKQSSSNKNTLSSQSSVKLQIESELSSIFGERISTSTPFNSFYCIDVTLDLLISQSFLNTYIKPGGFYALSQLNRLDDGNVVAFLPDSKIILNVDKETYQQLGLSGRASKLTSDSRYIIVLDCKSKDFLPESATYKRIQWCFKDRLSTVRLISFALNNDGKLKEIQFPEGTANIKVLPNSRRQSVDKYRVPVLHNSAAAVAFEQLDKLSQCDFINGWNEYIGMILCGVQADEKAEVGSVAPDGNDSYRVGECFVGSVSGMVHGFADSPVSWNQNEHGYEVNGDNDYSIILNNNNEYWTLSTINSADTYS
ncbi:RNase P protein subunit [Heterostelium album PN500]|uniref:RNase P protein subunit n=1 Tax=Heterostelium pallidum (strain ATCC 26659 / Pp 5 / PN500) TaxID=670386 RepID=D3B8Y6_HETP5|nr:RNase P protein subunit [Heterostelium album PN500]EFA82025.1 RNase P protein subunit [Heterostelium album PN500]|eukprot:XP_020434142.1 RNase P protein subunit [Heterostelium album PN500]